MTLKELKELASEISGSEWDRDKVMNFLEKIKKYGFKQDKLGIPRTANAYNHRPIENYWLKHTVDNKAEKSATFCKIFENEDHYNPVYFRVAKKRRDIYDDREYISIEYMIAHHSMEKILDHYNLEDKFEGVEI